VLPDNPVLPPGASRGRRAPLTIPACLRLNGCFRKSSTAGAGKKNSLRSNSFFPDRPICTVFPGRSESAQVVVPASGPRYFLNALEQSSARVRLSACAEHSASAWALLLFKLVRPFDCSCLALRANGLSDLRSLFPFVLSLSKETCRMSDQCSALPVGTANLPTLRRPVLACDSSDQSKICLSAASLFCSADGAGQKRK